MKEGKKRRVNMEGSDKRETRRGKKGIKIEKKE